MAKIHRSMDIHELVNTIFSQPPRGVTAAFMDPTGMKDFAVIDAITSHNEEKFERFMRKHSGLLVGCYASMPKCLAEKYICEDYAETGVSPKVLYGEFEYV